MSKALPVFRPHTSSAPLATYHFCMRSIVPVLRLTFEALHLSLLTFVFQVSVSRRGENVRLLTFLLFYYVLDGWSRGSLAPLVVSSLKFTDGPGACRLSFERVLDAIILRSSMSDVTPQSTLCLFSRTYWLYWWNL